ncbi:MAG: CocE/NonD family hydrolase [Woeseia sp.]
MKSERDRQATAGLESVQVESAYPSRVNSALLYLLAAMFGGMLTSCGLPDGGTSETGTPIQAAAEFGTARDQEPAGDKGFVIERDVAVRMRDGVVLRADVFRPANEGRFPVLVYRTPYGKSAATKSYDTHNEAVERGYAVVLQDVRGRYASEGHFDPYRNEGRDGYDTIEWAAQQSWSDGRVGTFGLSYPGAVQWLAAMESPPHLKAMAPAMTFSSPRHFFYTSGMFDMSWLPWIYQNVAPDRRLRQGLPGITNAEEARRTWPDVAQEYQSWRPLRELPYLREEAPFYFEWLKHPPQEPWWNWAELRGRYGTVDAAVLNLSGWFDESYGPEGAVTNFTGLQRTRQEGAARTHLILGPWTHGVQATQSQRAGDLDFGAAAAIDYDAAILDFFDHYIRGIDNAYGSAPAVRYFMMGENRWREASTWPPPDAVLADMHLQVGEDRQTSLSETPATGGPTSTTFVSDPEHPVYDPYTSFGARDYRQLASREDVLTFDTAPFSEELTIAGMINAVVYASCDCEDFDLWVRIQDVWPDGRAMNVMSPGNDVLRASYRDPEAAPQLLEPGDIYELRLEKLITAAEFAKGHRLRVQISAAFAPHFGPNLQSGKSEISSDESEVATIEIHHGGDYPSRLILPVLPES